MKKEQIHFHAIPSPQVLSHFESSDQGLSSGAAKERLNRYGPNEMGSDRKVPLLTIFIRQFLNVMVGILVVAAAISVYYGHAIDAAVIIGIVFLNAVIGFIQEYRAEKAVAALKKLVVQKVKVYRDGFIQEIFSRELVPGDVLLLEEGDLVPADARILSAHSLQTQESALTGESLPVDKVSRVLSADTQMSDLTNMVFSGTVVVRGVATAVTTATGTHTFLGAIAKDMQHIDERVTHFQIKSSELTRQMAEIAFVTAIVTFLVGYFVRGLGLESILPFTLAALVSAIPESLPLVLMIVLTMSAHRMAKRNAIVRHLNASETLGVVNVIITDKTGTLTQNEMFAQRIIFGVDAPVGSSVGDVPLLNKKRFEKLLSIALLCNNLRVLPDNDGREFIGDPTEKALFAYAQSMAPDVSSQWEKLEDVPFSSQLRARASLCKKRSTGEQEIFMVGAPESILEKCSHVQINGKHIKLTDKMRKTIEEHVGELTGNAMRVIGLAHKPVPSGLHSIDDTSFANLVWTGAIGLIDPPRPEAVESVGRVIAAGVRVIMATGDHPSTALSIADAVGIKPASFSVTAAQMETMTDKEITDTLRSTSVFARMTPQSKLRLARVLQKQGMILAMTGDGVNDAPALKGADVGVSMGKGGTDVAREASDIILADDNFATIVAAIEEGRTQFRNMRRTSFFLITTNVAESVSLLTFLFLGLPIPLLPKQVLWLNLIGGGLTDLALATEAIHEDVLQSPPHSAHERILNKQVLPLLLLSTLLMTGAALTVHQLYFLESEMKARTAVFITLSLMQLLNLFNMRSLKKSIFEIGVFTNKQVNYAFFVSLVFLLGVVYIPFIAKLFEFQALALPELFLMVLISFSILALGESVKFIQKYRFTD